MQLPKAYNPRKVEDTIYKSWEESGHFNPDVCVEKGFCKKDAETFCIVLPPPNVTGVLHMGHAATLAIEDVIVRYHRMKGDRTVWIPGTDHAAIATQSKVEQLLMEREGKTRTDLGREAFLKRVEQFAQDSHDTIVVQARKMGASLDWSREAYTLDEARRKAVYTAFKNMYDDELIIQNYRTVNWSVKGQSTLSDDEVEHIERDAKLYIFKYAKDFPISIATTRPETKLGDTAIAVHPNDKRYKKFIGKTFTADVGAAKPLHLKVIGDTSVDPAFGTGALGVTPAHSHADYEMYMKHSLKMIQVINEEGKMTVEAGRNYAGLEVEKAREKFVKWLNSEGLLETVEDIKQSIGVSDRYHDIVEVLPKKQWFVAVNKKFKIQNSKLKGIKTGQEVTLKQLMQHVVQEDLIEIIPDRFIKTYFHWIDNLRDWCISRQIWFGHRIPVWYHEAKCIPIKGREEEVSQCVEVVVSDTKPTCDHCNAKYTQDPDTLDTWFSTGLWTFSTMGWPDFVKTAAAGKPGPENDFANYYPTQVLETGYDILFFWVARMILMSTYHLGEIPFEKVYLHGLVRDEQGKKMSKTLGNVINPLDMVKEYGTDATRLSLIIGSTPGNDLKLSVEKIAGFRNFTNKLWNISRYILISIENPIVEVKEPRPKTLADEWIFARLAQVTKEYTQHIENFEFSIAGEKLRDFTWSELADWYLEIAKTQLTSNSLQLTTWQLLNYLLVQILKLWHPFMPFVTEEIWKNIGTSSREEQAADLLMIQRWPEVKKLKLKAESDFEVIRKIVTAIRSVRAEYKVEPKKKVDVVIGAGKKMLLIKKEEKTLKALARLKHVEVKLKATRPEKSVSVVADGAEVFIKLEGLVDLDREKERLEKEIKKAKEFVSASEKKLANKEFAQNAPKEIIGREKEMMSKQKKRLEKLEEQLKSL